VDSSSRACKQVEFLYMHRCKQVHKGTRSVVGQLSHCSTRCPVPKIKHWGQYCYQCPLFPVNKIVLSNYMAVGLNHQRSPRPTVDFKRHCIYIDTLPSPHNTTDHNPIKKPAVQIDKSSSGSLTNLLNSSLFSSDPQDANTQQQQ